MKEITGKGARVHNLNNIGLLLNRYILPVIEDNRSRRTTVRR